MRFSARWRCGLMGTMWSRHSYELKTEIPGWPEARSLSLIDSDSRKHQDFSPMYQPDIERIKEELYFIAASAATRRLRMQAQLLSQTDVPVLITGEAGSGKTTAAQLIHSLSLRSSFPFVRVKCAVLTCDLLENELFGYEHSSARGRESTPGKFEQCARGTILLDEFDAMPDLVQGRLLRLLETGEFFRRGGQTPIRADVRIIAASSGDLERAATEKRIQEELFYRLSVF